MHHKGTSNLQARGETGAALAKGAQNPTQKPLGQVCWASYMKRHMRKDSPERKLSKSALQTGLQCAGLLFSMCVFTFAHTFAYRYSIFIICALTSACGIEILPPICVALDQDD